MEWAGRATTAYHHAASPISLTLKDAPEATTSLPDFVKSVTPPCNLTPTLPGGHLQTMYTVVTKEDVPIDFKRHIFESDDMHYPGSYTVDFVAHIPDELKGGKDEGLPPRTKMFTDAEWAPIEAGSEDKTPMLIALHGLSGGSYEQYLKETIAPLAYGKGGPQFEVCVVNSRGCARSPVTTPRLFNARSTWDIRQTVKWLRKKYPNRPLFAVGFSLGANILVNYLGEEGEACELKGAVACSNPWDLAQGSISLQRSWLGKEVYSKTMATNLKKLFKRHLDVLKQNPKIDIEEVLNAKYLHEFDRYVDGSLPFTMIDKLTRTGLYSVPSGTTRRRVLIIVMHLQLTHF
ncbi:hypothetical protein FH972_024928 [Carpinus fangiana]|uniref:AB hydrolase-1 domain-containing protein n=1 Tax=Carpinus fangiana TaxID=176857 RepID=A0A5N6L0F8_9ROSI|nr:hypothetical protein FH972_024928 [Carpinus fangiana]